jgi:hypothetical protein
MAHVKQREFIKLLSENLCQKFNNVNVLEIGSLDINGSVRDYFNNCNYVGIDIGEGKGVDVICEGQNYDAPDDSYDYVILFEAMEHNPYWIETFNNMIRKRHFGSIRTGSCWAAAVHASDTFFKTQNCLNVCRYRAIMAGLFGEAGFKTTRDFKMIFAKANSCSGT